MRCKDLEGLMKKIDQKIHTHTNNVYFKSITKERAIGSLIIKYSFIIKEIYCNSCSENSTCEDYLKERKTNENNR